MPSATEISEQIARESERRARLGVPAFAGGFLYFLSAIIVTSTLSSAPTVGLLQGLAPALRGEAEPAVSPRAVEVKYISHHAFALIAGSVIKSIALVVLTLVLLLLLDAARFRRPETWAYARPLVLVGGIGLAVINIAHQIVGSIRAHSFAVGHDFTSHAVEQALTKGAVNVGSQYLDLLAALALTAGMIVVSLGAIRVGLLTRWMGVIGIFSGILILLPIGGATLEIVPAFWMLGMGMLYLGRWPNGDPPAWAAGEARPWATQAERRAEREDRSANGNGSGKGKPALASASDVAPAPAPAGSHKRGRKRRRTP
ncbi:MAG TPA: hypothetical protein VG053_02410 [Solirubrobacteraceae bacterium]|jgi:hypothetical protein|nr:hypothetical protein [Solirubrobacteraceae bacterium]